jgi:hypothetical protein
MAGGGGCARVAGYWLWTITVCDTAAVEAWGCARWVTQRMRLRQVLVDDVIALMRALIDAGAPQAQVRVTDLSGGRFAAVDLLSDAFAA